MCGICGKVSWVNEPKRETLLSMTQYLRHRGPDAEGVVLMGPVGFGHCRLAVIDLSPAANQPMLDHTGLFAIVYNGEIYNFHETREELRQRGAIFRTRTDTEVILEAYKAWGTRCVERFNGMFAFALWDKLQQCLFLARDRLGKKPLFYAPLQDGGVVFASEIKALERDPDVRQELNLRALNQYLSLGYTMTSDCILKGAKKLEAGHFLVVERGGSMGPKRYWDLAEHFHNKRRFRSPVQAVEELNGLIQDSIRLRLISDVPLGAFLSGGIDSSSIVAGMCTLRSPDQNFTFSVGFREKSYSELPEARAVAKTLGVRHSDKMVDEDVVLELPKIAYHADEPFADTSMIPMYYLAQFAREHVTVCLSGDGGDEIFGGYETYIADRLHNAFRWLPGSLVRLLSRGVDRFWPASFNKVSFDYKLRKFLQGHHLSPSRAHYFWRTIFTGDEKRELLVDDLYPLLADVDPYEQFDKYFREVEGCHYLDRAMYVDIKTWLVDDILVKVDRSTMAHSLEARAPFLDYRLVEFAASLPVEMKLRGLRGKYLLKASQRPFLPSFVIKRPKKGFNAPVSWWMNSSLCTLLLQALDEVDGRGFSPFRRASVIHLWEDHNCGRRDNGLKLFSILMFLLWYGRRSNLFPPYLTADKKRVENVASAH